MVDFDVVVFVPWLAGAMPALHEPHTSLQRSARDEELAGLRSFTVHFADRFRLFGNIESVGGIDLHSVGQFEGLDARFELRVFLAFCLMTRVELMEQIEL